MGALVEIATGTHVLDNALSAWQVVRHSLQGCIANVSVLTQAEPTEIWTPLDWTTATAYSGASLPSDGCPLLLHTEEARQGIHFLGTGKYHQCFINLDPLVLRN